MQSLRRKFLRIHGSMLLVVGLVASVLTTVGRSNGQGPFKFLAQNQMASIGMFEAYLLASVCGAFLLVGSFQENVKNWNRMGALVHLPLFITNITYWDFYPEVDMFTAGVVSTAAHVVLMAVESFFGFSKK